MNKKPTHFLVLKIIGFVAVAVAIAGLIFVFAGFGDFSNNLFMIGGFMFTFGLFIGVACLLSGFTPEIAKMKTESEKYIQAENKENLKEIASTSAEIGSDAITKVTRSVKSGLKDTMYCKHCGAEIDKDSKFCKSCGKEQ